MIFDLGIGVYQYANINICVCEVFIKICVFFRRGNIADNAATFGCSAAVIFSDPQQVAAEGTDEEHVRKQGDPGKNRD